MPSGHLLVTRNVNSFDVLMNYDNVVNFDTDIHAERRQILYRYHEDTTGLQR